MAKTILLLFTLLCSMQCVGENLRTEEVEFVSHGTTLSGSIVFPAGDIHAAVVFVHGSGKQARSLAWAERFARDGIAVLWRSCRSQAYGSSATTTRASQLICR